MDLEKEKLVKKEMRKLNSIFADLPADRKKLCANLIQNAAFMSVTLAELQEDIAERGAVITGVNGNGFETTMENPAQKSYNTMVNRYAAIIKQLADFLPDQKSDTVNKAGEALAAFVAKGKPKR